jgi:hypothetical protein
MSIPYLCISCYLAKPGDIGVAKSPGASSFGEARRLGIVQNRFWRSWLRRAALVGMSIPLTLDEVSPIIAACHHVVRVKVTIRPVARSVGKTAGCLRTSPRLSLVSEALAHFANSHVRAMRTLGNSPLLLGLLTVSPSSQQYEETITCTHYYADRAHCTRPSLV